MLSARLILVRHGQSTYNAQLRLQGQADPPLSETAREEARALAGALPRFAQVVTSDLVRASETAALLGYPDARRDRRWREIDIGEWEGRPLADFADEIEHSWRGGAITPAGGESWARFQRRVGGAVDELVAAGGSWLVVWHGGVVRAVVSHISGARAQDFAGPANTSVTVVSTGAR